MSMIQPCSARAAARISMICSATSASGPAQRICSFIPTYPPHQMWMSCGGALLAALLSLFLRETAPAVLARQRSAPTSVLQGNQP